MNQMLPSKDQYEVIIPGTWMMKQKQVDEEGLVFNCQICFCYFENRLSYDIHVNGLKHIKMEKLAHLTGASKRKNHVFSEVDTKLLTLADPLLGMDYVTEYRHMNSIIDYFCFLCNDWLASPINVVDHMTSEKHYMTYLFYNESSAYCEALKSDYNMSTIKLIASQIERKSQSRQWLIRIKSQQANGKWIDINSENCRHFSILPGHNLSSEYDPKNPPMKTPCTSFPLFLHQFSYIMRSVERYPQLSQIPSISTSSFLDCLMDVQINNQKDSEVCLQLANALTAALLKFRLSAIAKLDNVDSSNLKEKLNNLLLDAEAVTTKTIKLDA